METRLDQLTKLAVLIRQRNEVETAITSIIGRPMALGHLGEYIAATIFNIRLEKSAAARAIDGVFRDGSLMGRTVNVKWYPKQENLLDITPAKLPDIYLVLTGPSSAAMSSRGLSRPWRFDTVFCFDAPKLVTALRKAGVKVGVAASVRRVFWDAAEIYPVQTSSLLPVSDEQRKLLALFALD